MSVILFEPSEVYQDLADAYEGLKWHLRDRVTDNEFYKALRRLYFANVATYLCQYHDDSPLSADELRAISPFQTLAGDRHAGFVQTSPQLARQFLAAWSRLKYNLVTNDGECYQARDSFELLDALALSLAESVLDTEIETAAA
jgi:hypothetical protein